MPTTLNSSNRPQEKSTDPHRHARTFIKEGCSDTQRRKTLRLWRGEWWRWSDGRYRLLSVSQLKAELNKALKQSIDTRRILSGDGRAVPVTGGLVNNVLNALGADLMVKDDVEQPSWLIPDILSVDYLAATNGLVSLADNGMGQLQPHTPEWFSSVCVPYAYDPQAECPQWKKFLNQVLEGDVERIAILQEWFGYLLTPDTRFHKFVVMEGEGANGKSVALEVLEAMLGPENVSHVPLEVFGQRFQLHMTLNKLANIAPEVNENLKLDEGAVKQFVGGDTIYFDRKGISGISAKPTARLMVATNSRPAIADRSLGMWRRVLYLPFQITIPRAEQDRDLARKLKKELPGILNWALEGRRRLHQQGQFTDSTVSAAAAEEYRAESNPAQQFLAEHCRLEPNENTLVERVHGRFLHWANANGHPKLTAAQFGKELRKHYPHVKVRRTTTGTRPRAYVGFVVDDGDEPSSYNVCVEREAA